MSQQTEQEFLASLLSKLDMTDEEQGLAKQALLDMVTGNPLEAMRVGIVIAEQAMTRVVDAIHERQQEIL